MKEYHTLRSIIMSSKIVSLLVQTLFFFMAITVISFFAEVLPLASAGKPFRQTFDKWLSNEFSEPKILLRFVAAAVYVLIRNRRLFFGR